MPHGNPPWALAMMQGDVPLAGSEVSSRSHAPTCKGRTQLETRSKSLIHSRIPPGQSGAVPAQFYLQGSNIPIGADRSRNTEVSEYWPCVPKAWARSCSVRETPQGSREDCWVGEGSEQSPWQCSGAGYPHPHPVCFLL